MTEEETGAERGAEEAQLRTRLAEAEGTLRAIRCGEADALVVAGAEGDEVHLLGKGDRIYRQFIEAASEGTATLSAAGVIESCNDLLAKTLRRPLEQVLGAAMRDLLSPEDQQAFDAILAESGAAPRRRKVRLRTGEGALVPVYLSATLLHRAGAKPFFCLVFTDLEEVVSAEETLRGNEARYRALFENMLDAVLLTTPEGGILSANPAACLMFGRTQEELSALGRWAIVDVGDPRLATLLEERSRTGRASGEIACLRKDGSAFPAEVSSLVFSDRSGAMLTTMIVRDITERKRTEAERERLIVAIEAAAETVLVTDAKGRIQYVNPVFESITGYSRAEVIGKSSRLLKSGEHEQSLYREALDTVISGRVWRGRLVNSRKDGSLFTVDTTISPVRDEAGRIVNYVSVERDVTEHLRLVEERSGLEDQLRQAQKIEAIGQLAAGVAHDFNNLTAIVLGYGEMLLGRLRPEDPARSWAEQIVAAGKRSAALTRQLLAFSRKQMLQPEVLDLNALLLNLEKMLGRVIGEDVALQFDLAGDLGRIAADPGQIEQVVTNLVLNARDAMPRGGRLTVGTANVTLDEVFARNHKSVVPGEYVRLVVADTGSGMDKATLARLFEPFFTTKEQGKGTGLGLATAFGIVKQSGGYLYVDSQSGKGTTFTIYLPRTHAQPNAAAIETGAEPAPGGGEQILVVEDEASLRELCAAVLSRLGYRVGTAGSGPEALTLVREQGFEPDLVLTDVVMPGMSGAELAARLRRERPELKVLYMSGYPDEAIAPHGVLGPGISFLQKPFTESVLAAKVHQELGGARLAGTRPVRRVLLIDDDRQFLDLVRHFCEKRGHAFAGVDSAAGARAALAEGDFDVLLVDLNLPGTSGARILRELRAAGHAAPAIVLTGDVASADLDELRPLGVLRVLEKSSRAEPLLRAIEEVGAR